MKKWFVFVLIITLLTTTMGSTLVYAEKKPEGNNGAVDIASTSGILMEASTGQILYEKNADEPLRPASVTKVMTLLLIFEAIDSRKISLSDKVSISEHAASMGGSQVFLEPGEIQDVNTLIKCIAMASGNDASVAMAEFIAGSEEEFVARMNAKAKELGMNNTNFINCCGLDVTGHVTSAKDIAIMSRELTVKHPKIFEYTTVWMDEFVHSTKRGDSTFGLANTNKLLKQYNGATGLKTGSTSLAKFCLSATATRNDIDLIAVVMAAPEPKTRFKDAAALLDYGFAHCTIYEDENLTKELTPIPIKGGVTRQVFPTTDAPFRYVFVNGESPEDIKKEIHPATDIKAPIEKGAVIGKVTYTYNGKEVGSVDLKAKEGVAKITFLVSLQRILERFLLL